MVLKIPTLADGSVILRERQILALPYDPITLIHRETIRLRKNILNHIQLHVISAIQSTGPASIFPDMPWRIIKRIQVTTPDGKIIKNVSGVQLHLLNKMEFGTQEFSNFPALLDGVGVFSFDLVIPFYNHTGVESTLTANSTALNTNEFTELYLTVEYYPILTDLYAGEILLLSWELFVNILERETVNVSDQLEVRKKLIDFDAMYDIQNNNYFETLLPENTNLKTISLYTSSEDWERPLPATNVIRRIAIEDDGHAHSLRELSGHQVQSENQAYYNLEPGQNGGIFVIEFDKMRDLTSLYRTLGVNFPKLIVEFYDSYVQEEVPIHFGVFIRQVSMLPAP